LTANEIPSALTAVRCPTRQFFSSVRGAAWSSWAVFC